MTEHPTDAGDRVDPLAMRKPCKHGDLACGSGYWDCSKCKNEMRRAAYKRLTPEEKAYDNMVDPLNVYHTDYDQELKGCSCHISPPCSYCVSQGNEHED